MALGATREQADEALVSLSGHLVPTDPERVIAEMIEVLEPIVGHVVRW